ncbi:MAG: hypothetical protein U1E76_06495 [Planctomycetota bacterium]
MPVALRLRLGLKHVFRYLAIQALAVVALSVVMTGRVFPQWPGSDAAALPPIRLLRCVPAALALPLAWQVWAKRELYLHGHHLLTLGVAVPLALVALVRGSPSSQTLIAVLPLAYTCLADFLGRRFELDRSARGPIVALLALHALVNAVL